MTEEDTFEAKDKALEILPKISSVLSICGSLAILAECFYFERSRLKRVYNRLLCTMAAFDILESVWNFTSTWAIPAGRAAFGKGNDDSCTAQGFFLQLGLTSPILNAFLSWYYLLVIRYSWSEETIKEKAEPWMYGVSLLIGIGTSIAAVPLNLYHPSGFWCWIAGDGDGDDTKNTNNHALYRYALYFGPLIACFLVIAFCMGLLVITVRSLENASKKYLASSYAEKARARNKRDRKNGFKNKLRSTIAPKNRRSQELKRKDSGDKVKDQRMEDLSRKLEEVRQKSISRASMNINSTSNLGPAGTPAAASDASRILSLRKSKANSVSFCESITEHPHRSSRLMRASGTSATSTNSSSFSSPRAIAYLRNVHSSSLTSLSETDQTQVKVSPPAQSQSQSIRQSANDTESEQEHSLNLNGSSGSDADKSKVSSDNEKAALLSDNERAELPPSGPDDGDMEAQAPPTAQPQPLDNTKAEHAQNPSGSTVDADNCMDPSVDGDVEAQIPPAAQPQSSDKLGKTETEHEQNPSGSVVDADNCMDPSVNDKAADALPSDNDVEAQIPPNQMQSSSEPDNFEAEVENSTSDRKEANRTDSEKAPEPERSTIHLSSLAASTEEGGENDRNHDRDGLGSASVQSKSPLIAQDTKVDFLPSPLDGFAQADISLSCQTLITNNQSMRNNGGLGEDEGDATTAGEWADSQHKDSSNLQEFPIGLNRSVLEIDEPKSFRRRTDYSIGEPSTFQYEAVTNFDIGEKEEERDEIETKRKIFRESKIGARLSRKDKKKKKKKRKTKSRMVTEQALFYVLSFLLTFIWSIINRFYNLSDQVDTPYVVQVGNAFFDPLQGFINFLVYIRPKLISYRERHPDKTFIQCMKALIMHKEVGGHDVDLDKEAEEGAKKELSRWRKMQRRMSVEPKKAKANTNARKNSDASSNNHDRMSIASVEGEIDKMLVEEEEMDSR